MKKKKAGASGAPVKDIFYKKIPALAAYIDRVNAEELNFRKYIVREYRGVYYVERAMIHITRDGTISCNKKDFAPTDEEAAAIKREFGNHKMPESILARDVSSLKQLVSMSSDLYEFRSRKEDGIIMVQERRTFDDGSKAYLPWTFFNDGEWRCMEPDGPLPFWKPPVTRIKKMRIMIHEGAKAAIRVNQIINDDLITHPWKEELKKFEHWGMIGGALVPHRSDYDELRRERPLEVIYVCDNDWPGQSALQEISKMYGGALKGIKFDHRWPKAWDLADEFPNTKDFWTEKGRYIGPSLLTLTKPATWATTKKPNPEGKGPPITELRIPFREEWYHSVTPEAFVHKDFPNRILSMTEFNNEVSPFSDVDDTARLVKKDDTSKTAILKYSPAQPAGIYSSPEGRFINTHVPSRIKTEKGSVKPFLDFMDHLISEESDRLELLRWIATLIARPEIKMLYGVLLISETQGVGKGTLGERILTPIIGEWNVSYPSENEIVESNFNYWLAHKRLAVVHEIYAGHSAKAYNRLKSVVTDRYITVSKKYQANYDTENWMHIFACSNSIRAIQLSGDDRRWFVPKVTEEKQPVEWWTALNKWLDEDNGHGKIKYWAEEFLKTQNAVQRGDAAPWSSLKKEVVEEGYSPGMTLVAQFLNRVKEECGNDKWQEAYCKPAYCNGSWRPTGVCILDTDLVKLIKNHLYDGRQTDRLEKPLTLRKVAKLQGWYISEEKARNDKWGTRGVACRLICSSRAMAGTRISDLAENIKPIDVEKLAQEWQL